MLFQSQQAVYRNIAETLEYLMLNTCSVYYGYKALLFFDLDLNKYDFHLFS